MMKEKRLGTFTSGDPRQNRKGRPKKGSALTDILNLKLDEENKAGVMRREAVAEKLIKLAEAGDLVAIRYLMDRVDGRPRATVELADSAIDIKLKEILHG